MTKVLNFTSVAAAPVSERLACGLLDSHCENGLARSQRANQKAMIPGALKPTGLRS